METRTGNVEIGSDNVFADLGFSSSEELLLRANLIAIITDLIEKKGLTQTQIAERIALEPAGSFSPPPRPII